MVAWLHGCMVAWGHAGMRACGILLSRQKLYKDKKYEKKI
jgi:hypothetical protein